ncbi:MAG TPA: hypothetical protein VHP83_23125 [Aggregatilineaceae bacterium]|nr:hypothetical protein [Aggregatilineaceae bacterium]
MGRSLSTIIIWGVLAFLLAMMLTSPTGAVANANGAVLFGIVLVLTVAATLSTLAIWVGGAKREEEEVHHIAKAKRAYSNRVERLLEDLDDNEIYELEQRLLEGEQRRQAR